MEVNRQELLTALTLVRPGLSGNELIQQATSFVFVDGYVMTYNDEVSVRHPLELDFEAAIPAGKLYALLNKLSDDVLELEAKKGELVLKGVRTKAGVPLVADISLPVREVKIPQKDGDWLDLPEDFLGAVSLVLATVGKDMNKPLLTCVHAKENVVAGTDNKRITVAVLENEEEVPVELLIPGVAARQLLQYEVIQVVATEAWLHFRTPENTVFSCRTMKGDYPDVTQLFDFPGTNVPLPRDMVEMLERAGLMLTEKFVWDEQVSVRLGDNRLVIKAKGPDGWIEESVRVRYKGETMAFMINPTFLAAALEEEVEVCVGERLVQIDIPSKGLRQILAQIK